MSEQLIHGHAAFREKYFEERAFLKQLAKAQKPKALLIGCSDSRVVPEILTNSGIGDLFVVRNIANHVPPRSNKDLSVGAAIEYAVDVLEVPDVVVCGHYGCGGVKAVIDGLDKLDGRPELRKWLDGLQPAVKKAVASGLEGDALWRRAVEEHVLDSLDDLISFDVVRSRLEAGTLHVHGWVYDLYSTRLLAFDAQTDTWVDALEVSKHADDA